MVKAKEADPHIRHHSIVLNEDTHIMAVPLEKYKEILYGQIQQEMMRRLQVLSCLPFFEKFQQLALIGLANCLTPLKFKMGEVILRVGEIPKHLFIIASGRVSLVSESTMKRPS